MKRIAVSGYFDPPHIGHLRMFRAAKALGDRLIVIVNNDSQQRQKGSVPFMPLADRLELIRGFSCVDMAVESVDSDRTVCRTLEILRPDVFANGGDRGEGNVPEKGVCDRLGISLVYGVGGEKIRSSSILIREASLGLDDKNRGSWFSVDQVDSSAAGAENFLATAQKPYRGTCGIFAPIHPKECASPHDGGGVVGDSVG